MMIEVLKSKIHCARVTEANLNYMGSITIDEDLLDAANMIAGEKVYIADNNNGERFETYIIKGERGSGKICLKHIQGIFIYPCLCFKFSLCWAFPGSIFCIPHNIVKAGTKLLVVIHIFGGMRCNKLFGFQHRSGLSKICSPVFIKFNTIYFRIYRTFSIGI